MIEQTVQQAEAGVLGKEQRRRLQSYQRYVHMPFLKPFAQRIDRVMKQRPELPSYVPGNEVHGESLRPFSDQPLLTPPVVCMLCWGTGFLCMETFARHCFRTREAAHSAELYVLPTTFSA